MLYLRREPEFYNNLVPLNSHVNKDIYNAKLGAISKCPVNLSGQYKIVIGLDRKLYLDDYAGRRLELEIDKGTFLSQVGKFLRQRNSVINKNVFNYGANHKKRNVYTYHIPLYLGSWQPNKHDLPKFFEVYKTPNLLGDAQFNNVTDLRNVSNRLLHIDLETLGLYQIIDELFSDQEYYEFPIYFNWKDSNYSIFGYSVDTLSPVTKTISLHKNQTERNEFYTFNEDIQKAFVNNNIIFPKFINLEVEFEIEEVSNVAFTNIFGFITANKSISQSLNFEDCIKQVSGIINNLTNSEHNYGLKPTFYFENEHKQLIDIPTESDSYKKFEERVQTNIDVTNTDSLIQHNFTKEFGDYLEGKQYFEEHIPTSKFQEKFVTNYRTKLLTLSKLWLQREIEPEDDMFNIGFEPYWQRYIKDGLEQSLTVYKGSNQDKQFKLPTKTTLIVRNLSVGDILSIYDNYGSTVADFVVTSDVIKPTLRESAYELVENFNKDCKRNNYSFSFVLREFPDNRYGFDIVNHSFGDQEELENYIVIHIGNSFETVFGNKINKILKNVVNVYSEEHIQNLENIISGKYRYEDTVSDNFHIFNFTTLTNHDYYIAYPDTIVELLDKFGCNVMLGTDTKMFEISLVFIHQDKIYIRIPKLETDSNFVNRPLNIYVKQFPKIYDGNMIPLYSFGKPSNVIYNQVAELQYDNNSESERYFKDSFVDEFNSDTYLKQYMKFIRLHSTIGYLPNRLDQVDFRLIPTQITENQTFKDIRDAISDKDYLELDKRFDSLFNSNELKDKLQETKKTWNKLIVFNKTKVIEDIYKNQKKTFFQRDYWRLDIDKYININYSNTIKPKISKFEPESLCFYNGTLELDLPNVLSIDKHYQPKNSHELWFHLIMQDEEEYFKQDTNLFTSRRQMYYDLYNSKMNLTKILTPSIFINDSFYTDYAETIFRNIKYKLPKKYDGYNFGVVWYGNKQTKDNEFRVEARIDDTSKLFILEIHKFLELTDLLPADNSLLHQAYNTDVRKRDIIDEAIMPIIASIDNVSFADTAKSITDGLTFGLTYYVDDECIDEERSSEHETIYYRFKVKTNKFGKSHMFHVMTPEQILKIDGTDGSRKIDYKTELKDIRIVVDTDDSTYIDKITGKKQPIYIGDVTLKNIDVSHWFDPDTNELNRDKDFFFVDDIEFVFDMNNQIVTGPNVDSSFQEKYSRKRHKDMLQDSYLNSNNGHIKLSEAFYEITFERKLNHENPDVYMIKRYSPIVKSKQKDYPQSKFNQIIKAHKQHFVSNYPVKFNNYYKETYSYHTDNAYWGYLDYILNNYMKFQESVYIKRDTIRKQFGVENFKTYLDKNTVPIVFHNGEYISEADRENVSVLIEEQSINSVVWDLRTENDFYDKHKIAIKKHNTSYKPLLIPCEFFETCQLTSTQPYEQRFKFFKEYNLYSNLFQLTGGKLPENYNLPTLNMLSSVYNSLSGNPKHLTPTGIWNELPNEFVSSMFVKVNDIVIQTETKSQINYYDLLFEYVKPLSIGAIIGNEYNSHIYSRINPNVESHIKKLYINWLLLGKYKLEVIRDLYTHKRIDFEFDSKNKYVCKLDAQDITKSDTVEFVFQRV